VTDLQERVQIVKRDIMGPSVTVWVIVRRDVTVVAIVSNVKTVGMGINVLSNVQ